MSRYLEENLEMPLREALEIVQNRIKERSTYFGIRTRKSPLDLWVYQEMIFEMRPDVIVEIGNARRVPLLACSSSADVPSVRDAKLRWKLSQFGKSWIGSVHRHEHEGDQSISMPHNRSLNAVCQHRPPSVIRQQGHSLVTGKRQLMQMPGFVKMLDSLSMRRLHPLIVPAHNTAGRASSLPDRAASSKVRDDSAVRHKPVTPASHLIPSVPRPHNPVDAFSQHS